MKKLILIFMTVILVLAGLAGCSKNEDTPDTAQETAEEETVQEENEQEEEAEETVEILENEGDVEIIIPEDQVSAGE